MKNKYKIAFFGISISAMVAACFLGCGGLVADADTTSPAGGGPATDAGTAADADADASPAATFFLTQTALTNYLPNQTSYRYESFGWFYLPYVPHGPLCASSTVGDCAAKVCELPPPFPQGVTSSLNAGAITVAGAAGAVMLSFGPVFEDAGLYYHADGTTRFFKGGDAITFSGAGSADVPAFAPQTVIAPNDIVLTAPDCSGFSSCVDVDRTTDLRVAWTGSSVGNVVASLTTSGTKQVTVTCTFDAAAGTGTVPASLLATLESSGMARYFPQNGAAFRVATGDATFAVQGTGGGGGFKVSK
jgi:hypothetical protein